MLHAIITVILLSIIGYNDASDVAALGSCLDNYLLQQLVLPNASNYTLLSTGSRPRVSTKPMGIIKVSNLSQVSEIVKCAFDNNIQPVVRGGGHSYEGFSSVTGSLVISLYDCGDVKVFTSGKDAFAKIEAGARLGNVYQQLWNAGNYSYSAGTCPSVGIGGHITGGGYGMQSRKYGLAADQVVNMSVVLYNGTVVTANDKSNPDLFWALRGGGSGSFGIVLDYTVKLFKMPENVMFLITYREINTFTKILKAWQSYFPSSAKELSTQLTIRNEFINLRGHFMGKVSTLDAILKESGMLNFQNFTFLKQTNCSGLGARLFFGGDTTCSNFWMLSNTDDIFGTPKNYRKSKADFGSVPFTDEGLNVTIEGILKSPDKSWIQFEAYGGIFDKISPNETPFPNRKGTLFSLQYTVYLKPDEPETSPNYQWIRSFENSLKPFVNGQHYQNYPDLDLGQDFGVGYFGRENFKRLIKIKTSYDPLDIFRNPQSIPNSSKASKKMRVSRR